MACPCGKGWDTTDFGWITATGCREVQRRVREGSLKGRKVPDVNACERATTLLALVAESLYLKSGENAQLQGSRRKAFQRTLQTH